MAAFATPYGRRLTNEDLAIRSTYVPWIHVRVYVPTCNYQSALARTHERTERTHIWEYPSPSIAERNIDDLKNFFPHGFFSFLPFYFILFLSAYLCPTLSLSPLMFFFLYRVHSSPLYIPVLCYLLSPYRLVFPCRTALLFLIPLCFSRSVKCTRSLIDDFGD